MKRQSGHRGLAHGFVRFPVFPLAVVVAVVGLGALSALGQFVAGLSAVETVQACDPQGFRATRARFLLLLSTLLNVVSLLEREFRLEKGASRGAFHAAGFV